METQPLLELADRVAGWARDDEQVEVVVVHSRETDIRIYEAEVEKLSSAESQGVGIRVVRDNRQGFAHAGTFDVDVLAETLTDARDNASFATADEHLGLAEPDGVRVVELPLFHDALTDFPTARKIDLAAEMERAIRIGDHRIVGTEACDYGDSATASAVVTTTGIRAASRQTACYLYGDALARDGEETQTGFGFSIGREPGDLDTGEAAHDAVDRAIRMLGAVKPPSERLTIVLDPWVTAQFLGIVGGTLSAEAVLKGRSLFAERVGQEVGASIVTLIDDPTEPAAFSATETDGEGLATRRLPLIDAGVLQGFAHDSYTARRMGTRSTASAVRGYGSTPAPGCRAVFLTPGAGSQEQLVADVGDGILVQHVSGLHSGVNPVSGDFSTGAEGLRIRNGAVAEPVREFTIASTIQRMLKDVVAVGGDLRWLPMRAAGLTLVVADVTVSGV